MWTTRALPLVLTGGMTLAGLVAAAAAADKRAAGSIQGAARAAVSVSANEDSVIKRLVGYYRSSADSTRRVMIGWLGSRTLRVTWGPDYQGVGHLDGKRFQGVVRRERSGEETLGELRFQMGSGDTIRAELRVAPGDKAWSEVWVKVGGFGEEPADHTDERVRIPGGEEGGYVEKMPEALTKVPPLFPDAARAKNMDGTVLILTLVGRDGLVKDTRIVKSIPMLDDAAIAAVRQWTFKPATARGKPVAVWVAVPIRFTLH